MSTISAVDSMPLDLERLKAFRAVALEKSFSRGARRIFRTQPAVSQTIQQLEKQVGQKLFERQGRRIELTPAGQVLFEHVQQAFRALEAAQAQLDAIGGLKQGLLRIGASDTTTCYVLPPILRQFRTQYPGVEIIIANRPSPAILQQVIAREVELGMVTLPVRHAGIVVREAVTREDVVICAPRHPLADRRRLKMSDLAAHPLLLLDRGSNTRTFIDGRFHAAGVVPKIAMELASIDAIKNLVQLDLGISIVPRVAVEGEVARGELCALNLFRAEERRTLGFIHSRSVPLSRAGREFLTMALQELRGEAVR
jgi:DNA-binding transcriptional LysR family regulator